MKDIDYGAIAREAARFDGLTVSVAYIKVIIDAYEAQKRPPEWVPLDLATVKQGHEVRRARWANTELVHEFVATCKHFFVTYHAASGVSTGTLDPGDWLMRLPKPKTVKVKMWKRPDGKVYPFLDGEGPIGDGWSIVGEDEIEVRE